MLITAIMVFFLIEFAVRPVVVAVYARSQCLFAHKAHYHHFIFEMGSIHDSATGRETEHSMLEGKGKENQLLVFL